MAGNQISPEDIKKTNTPRYRKVVALIVAAGISAGIAFFAGRNCAYRVNDHEYGMIPSQCPTCNCQTYAALLPNTSYKDISEACACEPDEVDLSFYDSFTGAPDCICDRLDMNYGATAEPGATVGQPDNTKTKRVLHKRFSSHPRPAYHLNPNLVPASVPERGRFVPGDRYDRGVLPSNPVK
ncbi:MAG: hypothetical protein NT001_00280 [Candidatus Woesearchaeota archaeon]|nr:hypothetical protein [Candidatus Woesearchaeota archaeon]